MPYRLAKLGPFAVYWWIAWPLNPRELASWILWDHMDTDFWRFIRLRIWRLEFEYYRSPAERQ